MVCQCIISGPDGQTYTVACTNINQIHKFLSSQLKTTQNVYYITRISGKPLTKIKKHHQILHLHVHMRLLGGGNGPGREKEQNSTKESFGNLTTYMQKMGKKAMESFYGPQDFGDEDLLCDGDLHDIHTAIAKKFRIDVNNENNVPNWDKIQGWREEEWLEIIGIVNKDEVLGLDENNWEKIRTEFLNKWPAEHNKLFKPVFRSMEVSELDPPEWWHELEESKKEQYKNFVQGKSYNPNLKKQLLEQLDVCNSLKEADEFIEWYYLKPPEWWDDLEESEKSKYRTFVEGKKYHPNLKTKLETICRCPEEADEFIEWCFLKNKTLTEEHVMKLRLRRKSLDVQSFLVKTIGLDPDDLSIEHLKKRGIKPNKAHKAQSFYISEKFDTRYGVTQEKYEEFLSPEERKQVDDIRDLVWQFAYAFKSSAPYGSVERSFWTQGVVRKSVLLPLARLWYLETQHGTLSPNAEKFLNDMITP